MSIGVPVCTHYDGPPIHRIILLGASNLTAGLPFILPTLRAAFNAPLDVFAALGHGRSYGTWSRVLHRELPGIAECGLWNALRLEWPRSTEESLRNDQAGGLLCTIPATRPFALITDVGNDLLYGASPQQIAGWVENCLKRLTEQDAYVVLTTLPMASVERLSAWRYQFTRMIFFPGKGAPWTEMKRRAVALNDRLRELAKQYETQVVEPPGDWYGFDPIHIRYTKRKQAWRQILSQWPGMDLSRHVIRISVGQHLRLQGHQPELRRVFGREQTTPQPLHGLDGVTVWLY